MGWSEFWKGVGSFFAGKAEVPASVAIVKVEPPPEGAPYRKSDPPKDLPDLMYNIQGGEGVEYAKLEEFKAKSRRRAARYFQGKEVKHRVTRREPDTIEFEFNREHDPNRVPGGPVRIRWVNKAA